MNVLQQLIINKNKEKEELSADTTVALKLLPELRMLIRLQLEKAGLNGEDHTDNTRLVVVHEGFIYRIHAYKDFSGSKKIWYSRRPEEEPMSDDQYVVSPAITKDNDFFGDEKYKAVREYMFLQFLQS